MMDTARSPRPYAQRMAPDRRREQLLDAALRVIATQGVHKVSMDSVAKTAGVTRPVVYGHFADSNALLVAALERGEQHAVAQWAAAMPPLSAGKPDQVAILGFTNFLDQVIEHPDLWRAVFMLADSSTPAFRARLEAGRERAVDVLEALVRGAIDEGLDLETDAHLQARMLLAMMWEAGRQVLADPQTYPRARLVAFAEKAIPRYLKA